MVSAECFEVGCHAFFLAPFADGLFIYPDPFRQLILRPCACATRCASIRCHTLIPVDTQNLCSALDVGSQQHVDRQYLEQMIIHRKFLTTVWACKPRSVRVSNVTVNLLPLCPDRRSTVHGSFIPSRHRYSSFHSASPLQDMHSRLPLAHIKG